MRGLQRVRELDDKLRDKQREFDKVNEYNKQCKADITSLKTRLDIMSRHARRTTHVVTPRDLSSASSGYYEKVQIPPQKSVHAILDSVSFECRLHFVLNPFESYCCH